MLTNKELIRALLEFPLDAEIDMTASGYDCDGVSLSVGHTDLIEKEFVLCETHLIQSKESGPRGNR